MLDINFRFYEDANGQLDLQAMAEGLEFGCKVVDSVAARISSFMISLKAADVILAAPTGNSNLPKAKAIR
jgi:hypothetical protein